MRKTITSILTLVAMFIATSAVAQQTFTYDIKSYIGQSYEGYKQTLDIEAITAILGCDISEAKAYAVLPDGSLDEDCQPGKTDGWRDAEGNWQKWSPTLEEAPYFYVKLDLSAETNQISEVGGYPGHTDESVTYTATYKLVNPNDDSKVCFITVNLIYVPEPVFEITTNPAELEIVGSAELAVEQKPRTNTSSTSYRVQTGNLAELLGLDPDIFDYFWLRKLVYGIALDSETQLKANTLTQYTSSLWLNQLYDEDANPLEECYLGTNNADSRFRAQLSGYDGDSVTVTISQTGTLTTAPATNYSTYYIINGKKAFALKVVLNLIPDETPILPWAQKTCVGKETITVVSYVADDYDRQEISIDMDEILKNFPEGVVSSDLVFTKLTADGEPTSSYTANNGFWMDMESNAAAWGDIYDKVKGYYCEYAIGTIALGHSNKFEVGEAAKPTNSVFYLVCKNDYYELQIDYTIAEKEPEEVVPDPLLSTCEIVAVRSFEMQIIPSGEYQDDYMNQAIDFNLAEIQELIGSTSYRLWSQKWSESRGFYSDNAQQSMSGCSQGYWMNQDTINHAAVVGTWNSAPGNAFGIGIPNANPTTFSFWQMPNQRKVGDKYTSVFYFVSSDGKKCVQINLLVEYVSERVSYDIVGQTSIEAEGHDAEDAEEVAIEEFDLTAMFEALGCTQAEFEVVGEWVAKDEEGKWSTANYSEPGGFKFKTDGTTTGESDEVFMAGFNNMFEFESWIIDEANRDKTYTAQIAARYDGKLYIFNVTVKGDGVGTAINTINTAKTAGTIYNLQGQRISNLQRGINIVGGKKVLVK